MSKRAATKTPKKTAAKATTAKRGEQRNKLDALGLDAVCERIESGESITQIATSLGMLQKSMRDWIAADDTRSARVRISRELSADACDDLAVRELETLQPGATAAEIARARELASHYRWRASKRNPRIYGDKLDLNHSGKVELTDDQLDKRLSLLLAKAGMAGNDES